MDGLGIRKNGLMDPFSFGIQQYGSSFHCYKYYCVYIFYVKIRTGQIIIPKSLKFHQIG